jgi:uncharacterized protein YijF (DUF1287 family)
MPITGNPDYPRGREQGMIPSMRFLTLILSVVLAVPAFAGSEPSRLTAAARDQVGVTLTYDPAYVALDFPGGDLPRDRGVCTDVVIRALRDAWGIDLQLAVNRDMKADFAAYPALWGLTRPDRNIDHRRVPNLQTLFARIGAEVPLEEGPAPYLPGDIITWKLPGNLDHMGIVSDRRTEAGVPLILHNIGAGAKEEDILFAYPMTGHYRIGADEAKRLKALQ